MSSISRNHVPPSTKLLMRILERPGLVAAVRELPGAVLARLIDKIGLEDAGELVALASPAQLERVFDEDLWRADRAGGDEAFRPERFALWLRVLLEAGEDALVRRLCEVPHDLLALAVHRLVLVLDVDVLADELRPADEEADAIERAMESSVVEEWEEFRLIARDPDTWEDVWSALLSLDREHHDRLRAILEQCCAMSTEYISGQGGLYQVLTADEMLDGDVAAARDDRRGAEGFISPADARAFLELARRGDERGHDRGDDRGDDNDARDPITRAYFRELQVEAPAKHRAGSATPNGDAGGAVDELVTLLRDAAVIAPSSSRLLPALAAGDSKEEQAHLVAPLFEQAMSDLRQRDPARFAARAREVGYLVNVCIVGGAHEGRRPRPVEALEKVLRTCERGLRTQLAGASGTPTLALALLAKTPADVLFRRGCRVAGPSRQAP